MEKEETNQWTRERGFLAQHGPDLLLGVTCVIFLCLFIGGVSFVLFRPQVPGLNNLFKDPPPPPRNPMEQKLNLVPGEREVILFKPRPKAPAAQKPTPPQQGR